MNWPSYHLWLMPPEDWLQRLSAAVAQLARALGGPLFTPHITLTSQLTGSPGELSRRTLALAARLPALDVTLERMDCAHEYFRCIYLQVELTQALGRARLQARDAYDQASAPFFPHLSLAYGDFDDAHKQAAIAPLPDGLLGTFRAAGLSLIEAGGPDPASWRELCQARLP